MRFAVCLLVLLPICASASMTAHFIDVGQGDATLLEFECGAVLIDAGGDKEGAADLMTELDEFFKRRIDLNKSLEAVFITHTHLDHNRALREVVETYEVENYIHNGVYEGSGRSAAKWMRDHGGAGTIEDPIACEETDPEIRVLFRPLKENPGWSNTDYNNGNNKSLVIRVDYGEFSMLFTGDLEDVALETLVDRYESTGVLDVDLYQVGHHGSHNGTTISLLEVMTPEVAVISMGSWDDGRYRTGQGYQAKGFTTYAYGHPREQVVEWLQLVVDPLRAEPEVARVASGAKAFKDHEVRDAIYATGWDGTVRVQAEADGQLKISVDR